jgi:cation diffusion facilitator CzcD-associated flavoprotein CzcO
VHDGGNGAAAGAGAAAGGNGADGGPPAWRLEVAIVGGGPAGLATAATLKRAGIPATVLERSDRVGASWRKHYDRLHLHPVRWLSNLPGYRFSRKHGRWVSRDGVVRYLEGYARHHALDVRTGVEVRRLDRDRDAGEWVLDMPDGPIRARFVVVATGYNHTPVLPNWPGRDSFEGELVHGQDYRNPEPYRGRDVLVVGSGNTGAEIAVDLVEGGAGRVRLAVRTPPNVLLREANGIPGQVGGVLMRHFPARVADALFTGAQRLQVGDLSQYGLPRAPRGPYTQAVRDDVVPILDVGLVEMLKRGRVEVVAALAGFEGRSALLADGSRIEPDAVIACAGYARGLEPLVGHLGVIGEKGRPTVSRGRTHPNAPNVFFIGYTNPISGMFREFGIDARHIAKAIARERGRSAAAAPRKREPVAA